MSRVAANTVVIHLLGNEYQIACKPDEEKALKASAEHLDQQMRQIRDKGKIIGLERIAVMAALNLSHELLQLQATAAPRDDGSAESLQRINNKLDSALHRLKQLKI
jgi:cell division protein ZapA